MCRSSRTHQPPKHITTQSWLNRHSGKPRLLTLRCISHIGHALPRTPKLLDTSQIAEYRLESRVWCSKHRMAEHMLLNGRGSVAHAHRAHDATSVAGHMGTVTYNTFQRLCTAL